MMSREDLKKAASAARDTAKRARRLARSLASDRERLNRFAEETDERAAEMEAEAEALRPMTPRARQLHMCKRSSSRQTYLSGREAPAPPVPAGASFWSRRALQRAARLPQTVQGGELKRLRPAYSL